MVKLLLYERNLHVKQDSIYMYVMSNDFHSNFANNLNFNNVSNFEGFFCSTLIVLGIHRGVRYVIL